MRRLASFARVIVFDKRGSGLSDPVGEAATLEERMDDIRAVMDAAGSERADVFGWSEGATMAAVFGASRPDRVSALVLYGSFARGTPAEGYPWAVAPDGMGAVAAGGRGGMVGSGLQPDVLGAQPLRGRGARALVGALRAPVDEPKMARAALRLDMELDIRDVLPSVRLPTLVIHRTGDVLPVEGGALARGADSGRPLRRAGGARTIGPGSQTLTRSSTRSRSFLPASATSASPTACSPRCSSPT